MTTTRGRGAALCLTLALAVARGARAGDDETKKEDWREQAKAERLTPDEIERLAKTKLLVAGKEYRQAFEPYINSRLPTFVTSDALLNVYHALFEECLVRVERVRAAKLANVLRPIWDGLPGAAKRFDLQPTLLADVATRAQMTIGTALRLLGESTPGAPDDVAKAIDAEAARVTAAEGRSLPAWMGEPDAGLSFLDYGRFRPRGFYAGDARLESYFRAVSWLQAVPLRCGKQSEILTALLLDEALHSGDGAQASEAYASFVGAWAAALGDGGDLPLPASLARPAAGERWTEKSAATFADECARRWSDGGVGRKPDPSRGREPGLRVIPAIALPDGDLLEDGCTRSGERAWPTGLLVAAALGGDLARREALRGLDDAGSKPVAGAIEAASRVVGVPADGAASGGARNDLHSGYLRCLAALLDPADPAAPPLFSSDVWKVKSTNAVLAGWAQARHTWTLAAREDVFYLGAEQVVAGFVEPDPVFFARFAGVVRSTADFLEANGAFDARHDRDDLRIRLQAYAAFLRGPDRLKPRKDLPREQAHENEYVVAIALALGASDIFDSSAPRTDAAVDAHLAVVDDAIARLAGNDPLPEKLAACVGQNRTPFRARWRYVEGVAARLETMAKKQLQRIPWTPAENAFLREFGHVLASAMLYEGNSYESPRDDAPRATSVFARLGDGPPGYFHVAVARPRALYVLYPWNGGDVLCRGAVMPYREFVRGTRLTDAEWKTMLDSRDAPPEPGWMSPLTAAVHPVPK
jgi:hypothetical protein